MIVVAKDGSGFEACEVKNSQHIKKEHSRHLVNPQFIDALEKRFGNLRERVVIYRGIDTENQDCKYINAGNYLRECLSAKPHEEESDAEDDDTSPAP